MLWRRMALAVVLGCSTLGAGGWRLPFSVLGPDQGLPTGAITSLTQDSEGFIWVGTESALLRYEGGRCRRWGREDGLPSGFIHRVLPARGGGLWVATLRGLVRLREGRIEAPRFGSLTDLLPGEALALDQAGRLWVMTPKGLWTQRGDALDFDRRDERPGGRVFALAAGVGGAMHLGTEAGLRSYLPDGRVEAWGQAQGLGPAGVSVVAEDGAGRLWAGSGRSLAMKVPGAARFTDQSHRLGASLSPNSVPFVDHDGSLWLPTQGGALHLLGDRTERLDAAAGLPFRWVRTVFRDREGTLWTLGTALARLQGAGRVWNHSLGSGASGEVVWSITRDARGTILAATDDGAVRVEPTGLARIPGTEGRRIKSLTADPAGTLWLVSTIGPTLWLRPGSREAVVAPLGDLGFAVNSAMTDSRGQVWLGHVRHGVLRWDPASGRLVQEVAPPAGAPLGVFRIREDARGRMWAATNAGLYLRDSTGAWRRFTEADGLKPFGLYGLAFLPDGSAWVHYQEAQGLSRIRVEGDRLAVLEHRQKGPGLRSDLIYAVEVDRQGRTWATSDQGLDRLDPPLHVGRREGMVSEDCAIQALLAEGGRIWVGTAAGLVRYDPGPDPALPPPAAHLVAFTQGDRQLEPPFGPLAPVPHAEATVSFRLAAPAYRDEGQVRFQVRLLGLEEAWRDAEGPLVRYPALAGGAYRFEARAAQGDGPFGPVAALEFRIRPPWWRTWWALGLGGLAFLGAGFAVLRLRMASLARSKAELELLVAARTEELRARNEDLSTALGQVKQLSGLLPICSCCKKIRDDKGYWNRLEHYFSVHSGVDFTHGICPECAETLYPDHLRTPKGEAPESIG